MSDPTKTNWVAKHNAKVQEKLAKQHQAAAEKTYEHNVSEDNQAFSDALAQGEQFTVEVPDMTAEQFNALSTEEQARMIRENYNRRQVPAPPNDLPITQMINPPSHWASLTDEQRRKLSQVGINQPVESAWADALKREHEDVPYEGGGVREAKPGSPRFELLFPRGVPYYEQLLTRFAVHMAKGAEKYEERNWEKFRDDAALERSKAGALRHLVQWLSDEQDGEDHAAAVMFNLMAAELIKYKQRQGGDW